MYIREDNCQSVFKSDMLKPYLVKKNISERMLFTKIRGNNVLCNGTLGVFTSEISLCMCLIKENCERRKVSGGL